MRVQPVALHVPDGGMHPRSHCAVTPQAGTLVQDDQPGVTTQPPAHEHTPHAVRSCVSTPSQS